MSKYPQMEWPDGGADAPELFRLFKQKMNLVCEDNEITDPTRIATKIKIGLGDEGLRRLNASGLTDPKVVANEDAPAYRELLGKDSDLTLTNAISLGRQHEAATKGVEQLQAMNQTTSCIDHMRRIPPSREKKANTGQTTRECL
ncbi:hypothetical protein CAPTEDRAFT_194315 [Capitella teleta]|uniref:Uncharacterized protein n=1 Tax=Capitella teleta TaxID=283909 RepID=R7UFG6_CAPTE|nr:hypothetical protein CAPTEDRAFT_194315 [Capitella teleta]|eukprot:ELU02523.1 hypothetical protein CAPTEDRAFT_194315 [Capitella teleta]